LKKVSQIFFYPNKKYYIYIIIKKQIKTETMTTTVNNIKAELSTMTMEDLRSLHSAITNQIQYRNSLKLHQAKATLYVGAICKVDHPKAYGKQFRVEKINPKNVICREVNGSNVKWTITASMLQVIE
jgi:hypothetical protein